MCVNEAIPGERLGTVVRKYLGAYHVQLGDQLVKCEISSRLRKELVYPTADPSSLRHAVREVKEIRMVDPVAVGDEVRILELQDGSGYIQEVLPRRSKLVRLSAGRKPLEQVIVANLDQVVMVFAVAQPTPKWNLLDRYLVSAESAGLRAVICLTKKDLLLEGDYEVAQAIECYRQIGYPVILTSAVEGEGIAEFRAHVSGRFSAMIGKSGVGKTTLLNAMQPGLGLRVNEISRATGKGRHTTSNLEMYRLVGGGNLVDTPGMREFGLWEIDGTDLAWLFPEMRSFIGKCRFGLDCSHTHESDCAIQEAVDRGEVSAMRYQSYLRLMEG